MLGALGDTNKTVWCYSLGRLTVRTTPPPTHPHSTLKGNGGEFQLGFQGDGRFVQQSRGEGTIGRASKGKVWELSLSRGEKGKQRHRGQPQPRHLRVLGFGYFSSLGCHLASASPSVGPGSSAISCDTQETDPAPGEEGAGFIVSWVPLFPRTRWEQITKTPVSFIRTRFGPRTAQ